MQTRQLGKNGPELTTIGFGAWAIGGPWQFGWGRVDDNVSINAIHAALDNGINWIDTAAVYGFGHSESVVGQAIKGIREKIFIATKCGLVNDGFGNAINNLDPKSIRYEIELSLKRLQTDYIDLYQIHKPDPKIPVEDSWGTLVELKNEGKTRFIGVSTYDVALLEKCMKLEQVQSLQPPFSMIKREYEESVFPYCLENNIGVVAYSPMQAGLLSGKFDINKLDQDDWRRKNFFFKEPTLARVLTLVDKLKLIAKKSNRTVGQLAIAWVLKNPAITSAIVGARTAEQCRENIQASDYNLSEEEMEEINTYLKEFNLRDKL